MRIGNDPRRDLQAVRRRRSRRCASRATCRRRLLRPERQVDARRVPARAGGVPPHLERVRRPQAPDPRRWRQHKGTDYAAARARRCARSATASSCSQAGAVATATCSRSVTATATSVATATARIRRGHPRRRARDDRPDGRLRRDDRPRDGAAPALRDAGRRRAARSARRRSRDRAAIRFPTSERDAVRPRCAMRLLASLEVAGTTGVAKLAPQSSQHSARSTGAAPAASLPHVAWLLALAAGLAFALPSICAGAVRVGAGTTLAAALLRCDRASRCIVALLLDAPSRPARKPRRRRGRARRVGELARGDTASGARRAISRAVARRSDRSSSVTPRARCGAAALTPRDLASLLRPSPNARSAPAVRSSSSPTASRRSRCGCASCPPGRASIV